MSTALDRVMDQAQEAANAFPATNGGQLQPVSQTLPASQPTRPSLQSMADSAGIQVDDFLTVKEGGFRLGDMKGYFHEARVRIDLRDVIPIISIRANRQGQTQFIKSYDGIMTSQGQNFQQAEAHLRATFEKVDGPYQTVEIPATLLENVEDTTPKGVPSTTVNAGLRIGITPAITGVKFFTAFYNELRKQGLESAVVDVTIRHKPQHNNKGNDWGVVEFVDFQSAASAE